MDWIKRIPIRSNIFAAKTSNSDEKKQHRRPLPNFSPLIRKVKNGVKRITKVVSLSNEEKDGSIPYHTKTPLFAFLNKKTINNIHILTDDETYMNNNGNTRDFDIQDCSLLLIEDIEEKSFDDEHTSHAVSHSIIDEYIPQTETNATMDEKIDDMILIEKHPTTATAITADIAHLLTGIRSTVSQTINALVDNTRDLWNMNIVNPNLPLSSASISLPLNWHQQWPYNETDNRELSVKVVQARCILLNWYRKSTINMIDALHVRILLFIGHHQCFLDEYSIIKLIGKGTFAHVFQCQNIVSGKIDALKVYSKRILMDTQQIGHINDERILFDLIHKENQYRKKQMACHRRNYFNINVQQSDCKWRDISLLKDFMNPFVITVKHAFQDECSLYYIFEYISGGEIYFHLKERMRFTISEAKFITAQVALAIGFLHEFNFVWRSCKSEDILLDGRGFVKITDFGCGKLLSMEKCGNKKAMMKSHTFCWSIPEYAPPEMLASHTNTHGLEADWWSFGCFLYELVYGSPPFETHICQTIEEIYISIVNVSLSFPITSNFRMDNNSIAEYVQFKDICRRLLNKNPDERLGFGDRDMLEIIQHPFFNSMDFLQLLKKEIEPPFQPKRIKGVYDYGNIDESFISNVEVLEKFKNKTLHSKIKLNDDPWLNCDLKYF